MKTKPDDKGDKDDMLKQSNKSHKGIRDKLKKKRKQEKEIKKQKKEKRKEQKLRELKKKAKKEKRDQKKEDKDSDDDDYGSGNKGEAKLFKYIKKLKIFMEEEADDLFEMFETLDAGGEVMIEELENGKVKNYLKKIFKYFKLKKNSETNEYSKDADITPECLKKKFQDIWYQGVDTESSDSDDDNKKKKMEEEEDEEQEEARKELNEEEVLKAKNALLEGLKGIPQEAPKEKEPEPDNEPDGVKRIKGEEWRSFLDEKFGALVGDDRKGYSKLSKKMDGGTGEDRTDRDKKIDEFMTDYNSQFRKKTLLEEHQERKKNAIAAAGKETERRAFDRDLDLNMSRIDSKKVFQMINNKDNNLGSRFGHSSSGNKYL